MASEFAFDVQTWGAHDRAVLTVVIPVLAEPALVACLNSLQQSADASQRGISIILVVNHSETAPAEVVQANERNGEEIRQWAHRLRSARIGLTLMGPCSLPNRQAGVGLARKIGMDHAVGQLAEVGRDGIIACLDADCTVASNYVSALHRWFAQHSSSWAASINFAHPLDSSDDILRRAIIDYELHLRCYLYLQRQTGLPFAFHTVGSSMAVRSEAYGKVGGMPVRQAGEDFYFLHKFSSIGRLGSLTTTTVFPTGRVSQRVPFGTGRALHQYMQGAQQYTYQPAAFQPIRVMADSLEQLYHDKQPERWVSGQTEPLRTFLTSIQAPARCQEMLRHTASGRAFCQRFYQWFNAFRLMKYLHSARTVWPDRPVAEVARQLLADAGKPLGLTNEEMLYYFREIDRNALV